jgi:4-hydroxy 2-oxovalerate aldolase
MMTSPAFTVLDCTLRDGGYYTNWDFPPPLVQKYLTTIASLDVLAIEIGYVGPTLPGYYGRFYYCDADLLAHAKATLRPDQTLAVMMNAKDCDPAAAARYLAPAAGQIGLVRLAVNPEALAQGIDLARAAADCGYPVCVNVMYLSKYWNDVSVLAPLAKAAEFVTGVALVDSYGACFPEEVGAAMRAATALLPQPVGFHGHDNLGLAFSNALASLSAGAASVDATLLGMGRGAGNLRTEVILGYKALRLGSEFDVANLADILDDFEEMKQEFGWGNSLPYILSGFAGLPQKDVMDWLGKKRYSSWSIVRALQQQKTSSFDFRSFPKFAVAGHAQAKAARACVVIGGGPSVLEHRDALARWLERDGVTVIHSSMRHVETLKDVTVPQYVCLAGHELEKARKAYGTKIDTLPNVAGFVIMPAPRFEGVVPADGVGRPVMEVAPIGAPEASLGPVKDVSPLALALGAALAVEPEVLYVAGFDGYAKATDAQQEMAREVQTLLDGLRAGSKARVLSLTPTRYDVPLSSVYGLLAAGSPVAGGSPARGGFAA